MKKIYGMFGVEMRAYGQKFVKFCTHTHTQTHASKLVVEIKLCPDFVKPVWWIGGNRTLNSDILSFDPCALVSKLEQFYSLHNAPVRSAVEMSTWLRVVEICE